MTPLSPAPILARILADLAHDWTMRQATGDLTVSPDDAVVLASALRDLAAAARQMSSTFQRVVVERNELLAIVRQTEMTAAARARSAPVIHGRSPDIVELVCRHRDRAAGRDNVIDLTEVFDRERTARPQGGCHDPVA